MSDHYARQHKLQAKFEERIRDAFYWTRQMKSKHQDHISRIGRATYEHPDWQKLTGYTRAYLNGYEKRIWEQIQQHEVAWGFYWDKHPGQAFPAFGPDRIDLQPDWEGWTEEHFEGHHFWIDDDGTLTTKEW